MFHTVYEFVFELCVKILTFDFSAVKILINEGIKAYCDWWLALYHHAPHHIVVETGLLIFIIWLLFIRRTVDPDSAKSKKELTEKEIDWLVETWKPEPLVPPLNKNKQHILNQLKIIESTTGHYVRIRGVQNPVLNLSSYDLLGIGQLPKMKEAAAEALSFYGCGSCGPRGFYGTIDLHLKFETQIAIFMRTAEAISYSDSAAAVTSTIPAFAKRGDLILVDEACGEQIIAGLILSRATVHSFKHNDMAHLEMILASIANDDVRLKRDALQQRRFIVVEGLYRNVGDLCPLPKLIELKEKFFYRLIVDETLSFGVMGRTGRGITEHFGVDIADVEIINIAMDTVLASCGGVCLGSREIVDHQRLSGAGYCYSASAPPFFSNTALTALAELEQNPGRVQALHENTRLMATGLMKIPGLRLASGDSLESCTPILHLQLRSPGPSLCLADEEAVMRKLSTLCLEKGYGVSPVIPYKPSYPGISRGQQSGMVRPSVRICVTSLLTKEEISDFVRNIASCAHAVLDH